MIKLERTKIDRLSNIKRHLEAISEAVKQAICPDRITVEYPRERKKYPEQFRGYILFNKDLCISCYRCAHICPANAIKFEFYEKSYPSIDYSKCIFCHFCVESCPTGALRSTKIQDVAFNSIEDMDLKTTQIIKFPEIIRDEEKFTVEYAIENRNLRVLREKKLDDLEIKFLPPKVKKRKMECTDPESCIGCRMCVSICPNNALKVEKIEIKADNSVQTGFTIKLNPDLCTGCGLCVRQCPMRILTLVEVGE